MDINEVPQQVECIFPSSMKFRDSLKDSAYVNVRNSKEKMFLYSFADSVSELNGQRYPNRNKTLISSVYLE
jgi:hypothetical protein